MHVVIFHYAAKTTTLKFALKILPFDFNDSDACLDKNRACYSLFEGGGKTKAGGGGERGLERGGQSKHKIAEIQKSK